MDTGQRIAEADARAKEAELKLAQLSKKVTPRVISSKGETEIIDKLKQFAGTPFAIEIEPGAETEFVNRVVVVLERSGGEDFHTPTL